MCYTFSRVWLYMSTVVPLLSWWLCTQLYFQFAFLVTSVPLFLAGVVMFFTIVEHPKCVGGCGSNWLLAPPTSYAGLSSPDGKNDVTINVKADIDSELCCVKVLHTWLYVKIYSSHWAIKSFLFSWKCLFCEIIYLSDFKVWSPIHKSCLEIVCKIKQWYQSL